MHSKEFLVHRLRDFDSLKRLDKKCLPTLFIILRQFCKILRINEEKIKKLIKKNKSKFGGFEFFTREKTLDFIFFSKYYEPETTRYIQKQRGKIFVDIGAHIGRFAILGSKNFEKVYAFEPHPENFVQLTKNIKHNKIQKIEAENIGISNEKKVLFMDSLQMNTGAALIKNKGKYRIKTTTLDSFLKKYEISPKKIDLILIDVENLECEVLDGAKNFLEKTKANLIIECFDLKKITKILEKFGYKKIKALDFYNHLFSKLA